MLRLVESCCSVLNNPWIWTLNSSSLSRMSQFGVFFNENMFIDWKLSPFLVHPHFDPQTLTGIHGDFWDKVIQLRPFLPNLHIMVDWAFVSMHLSDSILKTFGFAFTYSILEYFTRFIWIWLRKLRYNMDPFITIVWVNPSHPQCSPFACQYVSTCTVFW